MSAEPSAREKFNATVAPYLAAQVATSSRWDGSGSARFAYFADEEQFVVVAGAQEKEHVDLALVYGETYRHHRRLVLVLPDGYAFPTLQRSAWLHAGARPEIYLHAGDSVSQCAVPDARKTIEELSDRLKPRESLHEELRRAATPMHLGNDGPAVFDLAEWATQNSHLDPSHRKSERAWHCMGQKVLSIRRESGGLRIRGGIHDSAGGKEPKGTLIPKGTQLPAEQRNGIQRRVEEGIAARLRGQYRRRDEHWLQAVIRHDPTVVGIEQPALREVPAWRPVAKGKTKAWHRGFIDLVGVDGHGDIRIVETKLATNRDDLLIFQGLDYYIWAHAYDAAIRERLGAPKKSKIVLHYVLGASADAGSELSKFAPAQANALAPEVEWRFQVVSDWYEPIGPRSELLEPGEVP
jgi:hypothetical protein